MAEHRSARIKRQAQLAPRLHVGVGLPRAVVWCPTTPVMCPTGDGDSLRDHRLLGPHGES
jgi:hypothetical protein